jgi:hypothetical protein
MKTVMTLWAKGVLREPLAIPKNPEGSRTPKVLNLLHFSSTTVTRGVINTAHAAGSREVRHNMQQFQAL